MRPCWCILTMATLVAPMLATPPSAPEGKASKEQIERLVHQLGSPKFREREAATAALEEIGIPALPLLEAALKGPDREVRARAEALVGRIRKLAETAGVLVPEYLHLKFKATPLQQAVRDLARTSGYPIELQGVPSTWADHTITVDTGKTTFWRAFDRFCHAAGLVEAPPQPSYYVPAGSSQLPRWAPPRRPAGTRRASAAAALVPLLVLALPDGPPAKAASPTARVRIRERPAFIPAVRTRSSLFLMVGKPVHWPTCYFGAVRVRVQPPEPPIPTRARTKDEILIILDAALEPRWSWIDADRVLVRRAVDSSGQKLEQATQVAGETDRLMRSPAKPPALLKPHDIAGYQMPWCERKVDVVLKVPAHAVRALKELGGTIEGRILTENRSLFWIPHLTKAAPKSMSGQAGSLKLKAVRKAHDGSFTIALEMTQAARVLPADTVWQSAPRNSLAPPGAPAPPSQTLILWGWAVLDRKGDPIPIASGTFKGPRRGSHTQEISLTVKPGAQGDPEELVFVGRLVVPVTIPFQFHDVRLP
ncbi:MAG TPA: hypothetical protein VFA18_19995 [Gemmataceae bacterium]|nr:hypothetical protein [Gemmataceae bacterium]